jgi:hypothetical protein
MSEPDAIGKYQQAVTRRRDDYPNRDELLL